MKLVRPLATLALAACAFAADPTLGDLLRSFTYRNLGPFRAGGWVVAIAAPESPAKARQRTFYAAARTGGVWKTSNNGTTFEPVTDSAGVASVGAVAVAPSDANVVWVGTGDNSATRSAYYGDGVYVSTDAGKTWRNSGLADSQHIARIVIHPTDPNTVWVAAMGHLHTPNAERGVFRTTDGGRTWKKVLYVDDTTGAVDLVIDHRNPSILYAAMYDVIRHAWRLRDGGPGSGIYKSTDGGATWHRLEGGLPQGTLGRIGIDICRTHPATLYAVVDNFNGRQRGEVYRTDDAGASWRKVSADTDDVSRKAGYSFNQLRVDPNNPERVFITGSNLIASSDGGKTWAGLGRGFERPFRRAFGDFRSLWIDPEDSDHMLASSDGGVFASYDGGKTVDHFEGLQLGEVYAIGLDMESPYHIYAGLQDHENWKGPVDGPSGAIGLEDWVTTGIGDGMYNEPDPNGRWLYNTQEFGRHARVDQQNHTRTVIAPTRPAGQPPLRFNWTAPIRISPHDSATIYAGAQVLFKSTDRGDHWSEISPDLTSNNPEKISPPGGSIQHCTITTISESPAKAGVIWVGTDDGKVQVTLDGGGHWRDTPVGPADAWVTRVFASRFDPAVAYVTKSRRRSDDFHAYVYRTADSGATWTQLSDGLPDANGNVIVEDTVNRALLFAGTDIGVYVSFDTGAHWMPLKSNMPVAPVHDLLVHPREGDLVAGTYGRGIWLTNITPLREMTADLPSKDAWLFAVRDFAQRREGAWGNYRLYGDRYPTAANEPNGMVVHYYLKQDGAVTLAIADAAGKEVRRISAQGKAGMNHAVWNLDDGQNRPAAAGEYSFTLQAGSTTLTRKARLLSRAAEDSPRAQRFGGEQ